MIEWSEKRMVRELVSHYKYNKHFVLPNFGEGLAGWEADLVVVRTSGWAEEIEVKVSQADFRAEFRTKEDKHRVLTLGTPTQIDYPFGPDRTYLESAGKDVSQFDNWDRAMNDPNCEPSWFRSNGDPGGFKDWGNCKPHFCRRYWFAMPRELAEKLLPEIPEHAGLLSVSEDGVRELKAAPNLPNAQKVDTKKRDKMNQSIYYRFWDLKIREWVK